jgi:hypothetical protein
MKIEPLLLLLALGMASIPSLASAQQNPSSASSSSAQTSSATQWRRTEKDDPNRERRLIQFTLKGSFVKSPRNEAPNRPALLVSCVPGRHDDTEGKFSDAQILVGSPLKIDYVEPLQLTTGNSYNPDVDVQFRADDRKIQTMRWLAGADKISAAIPKDAVKEMLRAHIVLMTVHEKDAGEVEMHFDMPDPAQIEKACDISPR